ARLHRGHVPVRIGGPRHLRHRRAALRPHTAARNRSGKRQHPCRSAHSSHSATPSLRVTTRRGGRWFPNLRPAAPPYPPPASAPVPSLPPTSAPAAPVPL